MSCLRHLTTGNQRTIIPTFSDATCVKTMATLEKTLMITHDWAVDRLHDLCQGEKDDLVKSVEDAYSIQCEFSEWLDPDKKPYEVISLEYIGEDL